MENLGNHLLLFSKSRQRLHYLTLKRKYTTKISMHGVSVQQFRADYLDI